MKPADLLAQLGRTAPCPQIRHIEEVPPRRARHAAWADWVDPDLRAALESRGIVMPWSHQMAAADLAHAGHHVVVATGTASGKSLAGWLPAVTAALAGNSAPNGRGSTTLYLSPTKALARDQLRSIDSWGLPGLRPAVYDGDTPAEDRTWALRHANLILTNPDLVHFSMLPGHSRWSSFLRALDYIIIDEAHTYRGVFGSHVAAIIRRLRRVAARYGSSPTIICASATMADPQVAASRLIGAPVKAVTDDGSPHGGVVFAMWEPELVEGKGENGSPARRSASAETATLLADLVCSHTRTIAFIRSRRGSEAVAMMARDHVSEIDRGLVDTVRSYRGGYLPEERRALEKDLRGGKILGMAATNALELGIDISGLDAVIISGWPGTRASLWQQAGRAGRGGQDALALFVARDDPLDTYLIEHPESVFGAPVETTVQDPSNPYVLGAHLAAAAQELPPLTENDCQTWFADCEPHRALAQMVDAGLLRARAAGWFWTDPSRAVELADLRGTGGAPVRIVEFGTGRLMGTVDAAASHTTVHDGAVYVHLGETYLVRTFDLDAGDALVERMDVDYTTMARDISAIDIVEESQSQSWGDSRLSYGTVDVSSQVVAFMRRRWLTGDVLGEEPLDLPMRTLRTSAVWWTVTPRLLKDASLEDVDIPGAAHAAEHASIGLLPLFATCDRWDIGGVSTAVHPQTGQCTVFVYDGHPGGAGFAERGYARAVQWLTATRDAIAGCECESGCPSCVQSPKCGNGNDPLDKDGAIRLLTALLRDAPRADLLEPTR